MRSAAIRFAKDTGGAVAIEAVLALPVLLFVFSLAAEMFTAAHRRVSVENAAYAAGRAALVYKCPPPNLGSAFGTITSMFSAACVDRTDKWENAARWALIAASPGSRHAIARGVCEQVPAAESVLAEAGLRTGLRSALRNRICYAFEPENVQVDVAWRIGLLDVPSLLSGPVTSAVEASVTYRYPTASPLGRLIADGQRSDGTYWIERTATVVIR